MNLQHAKVKDIQQLTIIFEDYKNYSLIPIDSLPFYESNQQFLQEKTKKKKKILLYAGGPPHEPWFILEAADEGYIVGPQKKLVAIYAMGEERL